MAGFIGNKPGAKYATLTRQTFSTPTGTSHVLSQTVTNSDDLLLYINNVKQNPADYTASGTTLTTASLAGGTEMYCLYYGKTTETVAPPASSVGDSHIVDMAASKLTGTVADARISALTASKLTGALPAISGASLTGIDGGDKRNFIIDGDFTQWPEGTTARTIANAYGPALMYLQKDGDGTATIERSTSVPTFAQSGYSSKHSMLIKCTGTDASVAVGAYKECSFRMTGTDFNFLKGKEVTVSFWAKTAAANSGDVYCYQVNKTGTSWAYLHEFTATSTWTRFTHTFTMDSVATADDETGLVYFGFGLGSTGSNYQGTNNTWNSGWKVATSGMNNFFDSTSNELYISQHMVTLGSSAPSAFTSPPIATVQDQVQYYVEAFNYDQEGSVIHLGTGCFVSTTQLRAHVPFATRKRVAPTMTSSTSMSPAHFAIQYGASGSDVNSITGLMHVSTVSFVFAVTHTPTVSGGEAGQLRVKAVSGAFVLADARH